MGLAEAHSFRQIGKHLRNSREMRGLSLAKISGACGLGVQELVRIENGEIVAFKKISERMLTNAQLYAQVLDVDLGSLEVQDIAVAKIHSKNVEVFIPVFLRKK